MAIQPDRLDIDAATEGLRALLTGLVESLHDTLAESWPTEPAEHRAVIADINRAGEDIVTITKLLSRIEDRLEDETCD